MVKELADDFRRKISMGYSVFDDTNSSVSFLSVTIDDGGVFVSPLITMG